MILNILFLVSTIVCGHSFTDKKVDTCNANITLPITTINSHELDKESLIQKKSFENNALLNLLSDYNLRRKMKDTKIQIGQNPFTIIEYIGSGAEGITYLAHDLNGNEVVIKALFKEGSTPASVKNEIYALEKLNRLIAADEDQLIIVQTFIKGPHFTSLLVDYSNEQAKPDDYPSKHQAYHLKEKYFEILYHFRNMTNMAHNDFRPYNIIGNEAIDFSRSEVLSNDPSTRTKELEYDDKNAADEWEWFYIDSDFYAIEKNPFLPNSLEIAYDIWDKYITRYSSYDSTKKYRSAWMTVLHTILLTRDADSIKFPSESEFY